MRRSVQPPKRVARPPLALGGKIAHVPHESALARMRHAGMARSCRLSRQDRKTFDRVPSPSQISRELGERDFSRSPIDSFSHCPHINTRLVHISRVVGRRLNQSAPEIVNISSKGLSPPLPVQDFVAGPDRPPVRVAQYGLVNACTAGARFNSAVNSLFQPSQLTLQRMRIASSGSCPSCAIRSVCTCQYQGVSHAEWPKDQHEYAPTQTDSTIY